MIKIEVRKDRVGPILGRHPWVFSGALKTIPDGVKSGEEVILFAEDGRFLGKGYFNSYSQIAVRIWSYDEKEEVNDEFFINRIEGAYNLRKKYIENKKTDSCRLINSENDFLPGLIVDKYADYLVLQFHTPGIEFWKEKIVRALVKVLKPKGIYERSDVKVRGIEGAEKQAGLLHGKVPEKIKISENGFLFWVDVMGGQKTGFFLDQREKRAALSKYCDDVSVLNCFSYTGGFSVYALAGGARSVTSIDASEPAIELAKENIKLNKLDIKKCEFVIDDVKIYLREQLAQKTKTQESPFDIIILDPPAFIKDRRKIDEGIRGYKSINEGAIRLLPKDGILVTCSCSAHLPLTHFRYMLSESAGWAKKSLQILETYTNAPDHPELIAFTESGYLKCIFGKIS